MTDPDHSAPLADDPAAAARARVARLLDPGSGVRVGVGAGAQHVERGTLDGRPVLVAADLPAVPAGAPFLQAIDAHPQPAEAMAAALGIALVRLCQPTGTAGMASRDAGGHGDAWSTLHDCMTRVPVLAVYAFAGQAASTPAAGLHPVDALRLLCSHVAIGICSDPEAPPADVPVDAWDESDDAAFARVRRILACLPRRAGEPVPPTAPTAATNAPPSGPPTVAVVPPPADRRLPWDPAPLLSAVLDPGSLVPVWMGQAAPMGQAAATTGQLLAGFARVDGVACAVLAGDDTEHAPLWTPANAQRALRLLAVATTFGLPLVQLADGPGVAAGALAAALGGARPDLPGEDVPGSVAAGTLALHALDGLRTLARLRAALLAPGLATCTIATRTWYADAPAADARHGVRLRYAWQDACRFERDDAASAEALAALLDTAPDPERLRADIAAIRAPARASLHAVRTGAVDAVVAVDDTRARLREFVRLLPGQPTPGR